MVSPGPTTRPALKWYEFETKDIITIIISLLALTLSCITAYNQFVPTPDLAFFATNLGMSPNGPYIDLVVSNDGNKPGTVMSAALYLKKPGQSECGAKPDTNWKAFELDGKPVSMGVYPIKPADSVVRRIFFESEALSTDMNNSPIDKTGIASRNFCIEVGTLDRDNCPVWTTMDLGTMWFYPGAPEWSSSSNHVPVKGIPNKKSDDPYCLDRKKS
jgi:hypothetical protein